MIGFGKIRKWSRKKEAIYKKEESGTGINYNRKTKVEQGNVSRTEIKIEIWKFDEIKQI